jgi:methylmalonyl-CoA mutase
MTHELCTATWSAFREIEQQGGVWAALETGLIQRHAAAVRAERERAVGRRADILTGTNEYPNINEVLPAVLAVAPAALPNDETAVTAAALPRIRLAEPFEQLRDTSDKILAATGARPKVFLAALGKPADFNARANFAKNFFEAGGIEVVGGEDGPSPLAAAFKASGAALACLCGSDKTYESEVAGAAGALVAAGARHIYLAGQPGKNETTYRHAGVQTFVHAGCDALATLQAAYQILAG